MDIEIDIEDFKNKTADIFCKNNIFFSKDYNNDTTYNEGDIVNVKKNYVTFFYRSLQDNNLNNDLSLKEWWESIEGEFITDTMLNDEIKKAKMLILSGIFCPINDPEILKELLYNLVGCFIILNLEGQEAGIITNESIDNMSLSKSFSNYIVSYPMFNNVFGQKFYFLVKQLLKGPDVCSCFVINNDSFDYTSQ